MSNLLAAAEQHPETAILLDVNPWVVGGVTLAVFVLLGIGLFAFGKGREHS